VVAPVNFGKGLAARANRSSRLAAYNAWHMWHQHLFNLLSRAWHSSVGSLGSTTLAIVFAAIIFLGIQALKTYRNRHSMQEFWRTHWKENIRDGVIVTACVWAILFSWNVSKTVYEDHVGLVTANTMLSVKNRELEDANQKLREPSKPADREPSSQKLPRLRIQDKNGPLNGRVLYRDEQGNLNFPDPLQIKNIGSLSTQHVAVRVSFSEVVALTVMQFWQSTGTGDEEFPFELYIGGPITIDPGERWICPPLAGKKVTQGDKPIIVRIKVFYGAVEPEQATFRIEKPKLHPALSP
jgi:hypothetical protein